MPFSGALAAPLAQPIAQTFYMPQPPASIVDYFRNQNSSVPTYQVHVLQSFVVTQPDTTVVYDHWEDGYEADLNNPIQATTQVWGDGNLSNGVAPGHPTDLLDPGDVVTMQGDPVAYTGAYPAGPRPQRPSTSTIFEYDGGDKTGSTRVIGVEAAAWLVPDVTFTSPDPGYQQADMMTVYPSSGPQSR